jgi:hypothetical protein
MRPVGVLTLLLVVACSAPTAPRPPASTRRADAAARKDASAPVEAGSIGNAIDPGALDAAAGDDGGPAPETTSDASAADASCGAVSRACQGDTLVACGADGKSTSTDCAHGCNPMTLLCNQCKPNERSCQAGGQVVCRPDGTGTDTTACDNGCNAAEGECNGCTAGTQWCNGDTLRECTAAGQQRDKQVCPFGCDGTRMACNVCKPGSRSCNGDTLVTCKADGSGTTMMSCGDGCNPDRRMCNRCRPNTRQCNGLNTQICRADGTGFNDLPGAVDCRKPLGQGCGGNGDCASGFCARGICCNTACDGVCLSCVGSENGGQTGTCGPARTDSDPHDDCSTTAPAGCGTDGACDGAGRCRRYGSSTECQPAVCSNGKATAAAHCDGQGRCQTGSASDCAPFACGPTSCLDGCSKDADCAPGLTCKGGKCGTASPAADLGAACGTGSQCASGFCTDGVCCNASACDPCKKCGSQGKCEVNVAHGQTDDGCAPPASCDGNGKCSGPPAACAGVQCAGGGACQRENSQCLAVADLFGTPCEQDLCGRSPPGCRGRVESAKVTSAGGSDLDRACHNSFPDLASKVCGGSDVVTALKAGKTVTVDLVSQTYDGDGKPVPGSRKTAEHRTCPPLSN